MIIVTGATGTTGSEIVKLLNEAGIKVRALVKDMSRADDIAGPMVELAEGDFDKPHTLVGAMQGVDRLYMLVPFDPREVEYQMNLINAARQAGVRYIVKHSALGASLDSPAQVLRDHREVEMELERAGFTNTILRPQTFMQNVLMQAPSILRDDLRSDAIR